MKTVDRYIIRISKHRRIGIYYSTRRNLLIIGGSYKIAGAVRWLVEKYWRRIEYQEGMTRPTYGIIVYHFPMKPMMFENGLDRLRAKGYILEEVESLQRAMR